MMRWRELFDPTPPPLAPPRTRTIAEHVALAEQLIAESRRCSLYNDAHSMLLEANAHAQLATAKALIERAEEAA